MDTGKRHENLKLSKLYISGYKFTTNWSVTFKEDSHYWPKFPFFLTCDFLRGVRNSYLI